MNVCIIWIKIGTFDTKLFLGKITAQKNSENCTKSRATRISKEECNLEGGVWNLLHAIE